jgi:hypothetical protein
MNQILSVITSMLPALPKGMPLQESGYQHAVRAPPTESHVVPSIVQTTPTASIDSVTPTTSLLSSSRTTSIEDPAVQAPASPVVRDNGFGPSRTQSFRQLFAATEPKYTDCFGPIVFTREHKSGMTLTGWRVTNLALRQWEKLEVSLVSLISESRQRIECMRPLYRPNDPLRTNRFPSFMLRCFMLGPNLEHAAPYVAILCSEGWFRKSVKRVITKSGLLNADGFKCFGLPDKPELYMAWTGMPGVENGPQELVNFKDFKIRGPINPENSNGEPIEIVFDGKVMGRATIGGVVEAAGYRLGMTVRHAFQYPSDHFENKITTTEKRFIETDECEIDLFDSYSDLNDIENEMHEQTHLR